MALTRIKSYNIQDREVREQDLADGSITFDKINFVSGGDAGHVLKTDGSGNLFWELASGTSSTLNSLLDVDVSTNPPVIGDSLGYNGVSWVPQTSISGNPSNLSLNNLTDTTISSPGQKHVLQYVGTEWINSPLSADEVIGIAPVALSNDIDDLSNVDLSTPPTSGQTLMWIGDRFVPRTVAGTDSIGNFDDVDLTGLGTGDVLAWDGMFFVPVDVGISPVSSNTFVVDDIAARDVLTPAPGDQCFVRTGTSGEYEMYVYDATWILIGTQDSARTDANTSEAIVMWNTGSPVLIGNVSQDSRVTTVTVEITTAFNDAAASLTVGDVGDNSRLLTNDMIDLTEVGTYVCNVDYIYTAPTDTDVSAYFNFGTSTQGEARVIVTHV